MAFTQTNARLILGYSSVAQLGFITLGIFAAATTRQGAQGALLQSVNHGLVVAPLFFIVALLAERAAGSEDIRDMGGIAFRAPVLAALFLIVALAHAGDARLGELRRRVPDPARRLRREDGRSRSSPSIGVVLASVYALRLFIRSMHNRVGAERDVASRCRSRDGLVLVPLVLGDPRASRSYPQARARRRPRAAVKRVVAPGAAGRSARSEAATEVRAMIVAAGQGRRTIDWAALSPLSSR